MSDPWLQAIEQGFRWAEAHPLTTYGILGGGTVAGMLLRHWVSHALTHPRQPHADEAYGSASWATEREVWGAGLLSGDGVVLGQLGPSPDALLRAGRLHVIGVGPSGIGKSTLLICTLRSWMGDAIVLDLTGDLIKHTAAYRPGDVYIWEPASLSSMRLNPYDLVRWRTPFETMDVQRVSAHLTAIDEAQKSDIGTYYKDIAELVLTFTPIYLYYDRLDPSSGESLGVSPRGLMTFLRNVPAESLEKLLERMARMPHETVRLGAQALLKETPTRRVDGWNAAARWLNPWIDPVLSQATATDVENSRTIRIPVKDLQQGYTPITLYIRATPEDVQGRLRNQIRLMLEQVLMWAKDRDAEAYERELLVALDDMAELGYVSLVERIAAFDRKYGIRLCTLLQDFNQLWKHFGPYTSLLSNCGVWVVFQPNDPRNADFLTGKLGDMTWREPTVRVTRQPFSLFGSRSRAEVSHARPLMTSEEVQKMSPDEVLIFTRGLKIKARAVRYFDHPVFRGAA
jgi:type IV secretion system protein VirD4